MRIVLLMPILVFAMSQFIFSEEEVLSKESTTDEKLRKIKEKLENRKVKVDFKEITLDELCDYIDKVHGFNVVIDNDCYEDSKPQDIKLTLTVKDLSLKATLKFLLEPKFTMIYEDGVLKIIPKKKLDKKLITEIYDVRDLLFQIKDFQGPTLALKASEDEEGASLSTSVFVPKGPQIEFTPDFISELIKNTIEPESWTENNANIEVCNGMLIVTQSKRIQNLVREFLDMLRQFK